MKKKLVVILLALLAVAFIGGALVYKFVYNKPHPDYLSLKPDHSLTAEALYQAFILDQTAASTTYNGKVVELSGNLTKTEQADSLVIAVFVFKQGDFGDEGIRCSMDPRESQKALSLSPNQEVTIKGYLTGYNGTDIILEKCSISK